MNTTMNIRQYLSYTRLSLLSTAALIFYAYFTREQFYPAVVYLTTSKLAHVLLGNAAVAFSKLTYSVIVAIFLGDLREVERDAVSEGLRWNLTETCLALTIFREEISVHLVVMFLSLVVFKCLHWTVEIRGLHNQHLMDDAIHDHHDHDDNHNNDENGDEVEADARPRRGVWYFLRQLYDGNSLLAFLLLLVDVVMVNYCVQDILKSGPSVRILFGFEFAILGVISITTVALHFLHMIDVIHQSETGHAWSPKGMLNLFVELVADGLKFLFYITFFSIVFTYYGVPLNLLRDLYISYHNLRKRIVAFVKYRELTRNMNDRFRDATDEELEACGHVCIICRDTMANSEERQRRPNDINAGGKVLPCGHVFHFFCLRSWLQQQQSCPTCRTDIPTTARTTVDAGATEPQADAPTEAADGANTEDGHQQTEDDNASPSSGEAAAANSEDRAHDDGNSSFSFPCMCQVTNERGATVWNDEFTDTVRYLMHGTTVVCQERKKTSDLDTDGPSVNALKIPDGWVYERDVVHVPLNFSMFIDHYSSPEGSMGFEKIQEDVEMSRMRSELQSMQGEIAKLRDHFRNRIIGTQTGRD
eukprot:CAMPEP_0196802174 /NCGR_PEP_ID=MMETSP1362-20130617/1839_1 /TAXON_ID=163516 /ORGANISM="Leptocylindrus danicus, Strain CCMP1856" /LENGTH=587 /DNA_ID=CAMNT_0042173395 /DNA_START=150 /DNA_END=1913 /DNA_ORIENTATION=+